MSNKAIGGGNDPATGILTRAATLVRRNLVVTGVIALVALGTLGAGLKYLDEDAQRMVAARKGGRMSEIEENSLVSRLNPFLAAMPTPTPLPLSKEYIYAGSRLLAVEDANASAIPPGDLAVWRPSTGVWWVLGGPGSTQFATQFGMAGDIPLKGDFDGDGRTELSYFRPSNSQWWIYRSSDNQNSVQTFGLATDIPTAADFDGDGRTDVGVYRPTDRIWYILQSSNQQMYYGFFGLTEDTPVPADYDGDGKADLAVWRPSDQIFWVSDNRGQTTASQFPAAAYPNATPVPADYDGDGKADFAIRTGANWVIRKSSDGTTVTTAWQSASDIAVPNDYDGDGKADIAVWRPSNGTWYILNSSNNSTRVQQWGQNGDIPVPAYFRR